MLEVRNNQLFEPGEGSVVDMDELDQACVRIEKEFPRSKPAFHVRSLEPRYVCEVTLADGRSFTGYGNTAQVAEQDVSRQITDSPTT